MPDKRVVFPLYMLDAPRYGKRFWSMVDQLITSMTSYFRAGNMVPVIVGTDSDDVKAIVGQVARHFNYPVDVTVNGNSEIMGTAGRFAEAICRDRMDECRFDVVTSKIFAMLNVGSEYDRLVVDIDTLWFGKVPWEQFGNSSSKGMTMFAPPQWKHPLSITVGQMLYYRSRFLANTSLEEYCRKLVSVDERWKVVPLISSLPWPNSGVIYMTSEFTRERYAKELDNPAMPLLSVEDETPLVSLLLAGGGYETRIGMNVPVAFTDITMEEDPLHPAGVICAHFHRSPKPDTFNVTYGGVLRHPDLHDGRSLDFLKDSIASGQYGSMSGILWCYVWRYYFSIASRIYRNGDEVPVYGQDFWEGILECYRKSRQIWLDGIEGQKAMLGFKL